MKVSEMIELLSKEDPDTEVLLETDHGQTLSDPSSFGYVYCDDDLEPYDPDDVLDEDGNIESGVAKYLLIYGE